MDQYIGKVLGKRYEILERIGSGGMAVVYKAKCHLLNRFVAVKILKEDLAGDEEFRRRFHEESQAVAMLSHPNIVSIYDVSRSQDHSEPDYIVMELIEGITLKQYMQKRGGRLEWEAAVHFITQIMMGLSHAHSRGIIHRDIKPHNIMILRDGSVRVADFGIARLVSSNQNTMTQEALGSVHYISPEQARGSHIDCRSDIYSAGVVLYEMLTGRLPYEGDTPVAVAIQHINSIPLSPRELDPSIPQALEEITMKAMVSDVNKRYASADAMLADLEEFRKNPNISFDYTPEELLVGEGEEPTQPITSEQPVPVRPAHMERYEPKKGGSLRKRRPRTRPNEEEDDDDYDEGGGFARTLVIISALILCFVGVFAFLWETVFKDIWISDELYQVPLVTGYTLEEAQELDLIVNGTFVIKEGKHVPSEKVEEGRIVEQDPKPGDEVNSRGQTITVTISTGSEELKIPDVTDTDWRVAKTRLENMGLVVKVEQANSENITADRVISTQPDVDTAVERGDEVTLVVSLGRLRQEKTMISVISMKREDAVKTLTDMGLRVVKVNEVPSEQYAEGRICGQTPPSNSVVKEGDDVILDVSTGPDILPPPGVTQIPSGQATPEPTHAAQTPKSKNITVNLPDDGRESVSIRITVGGKEAVPEQVWDTRLRFARFTVEGTGVQEIVVYVDGVAVNTYNEDFSR